VEANEVKRAIQIRNIVTSLGPAYIKLGQALSIRCGEAVEGARLPESACTARDWE